MNDKNDLDQGSNTPEETPENSNLSQFSGKKSDFHKSFWPTVAVMLFLIPQILFFAIGYFSQIAAVIVFITAIVLRITLEKKNHYLAKGFLWGALASVLIPLIVLLLLFGSCMLLLGGM